MKSGNPVSFILGLIILIITAGAVIQFIAKPPQPPAGPARPRKEKPRQDITRPAVRNQQAPPKAVLPPAAIQFPVTVPTPVIPPSPQSQAGLALGTIAIVLDDWGYNRTNLPAMQGIPFPITTAILPNLPHSRDVAAELHAMGKEVILHLPMQPIENLKLEKNTVTVDLPDEKIREILTQGLANIQYARGMNNHMGSRATQDKRVMSDVIEELKERNLYYLDSYTVPASLGTDVAREHGVPYAKRDIFLDNDLAPEAIKHQLETLMEKARSRGYAIGIGHDRKATVEVLREMMPQMAAAGFKFVTVSEILKLKE